MKLKVLRGCLAILFAVFCIVFACMIYSLSSEDGDVSSVRSLQITQMIQENLSEYASQSSLGTKLYHGVQSFIESISPNGNNWYLNIRDLAHFFLFFFLAILLFVTLSIAGISRWIKTIFVLLSCVAYSFFDEIHQASVYGRISTLDDVFMDSFGAICGIVLCLVVSVVSTRVSRRRNA